MFNSIDDILYVVIQKLQVLYYFNINDLKKQLEIKVYTRINLINYYFDKINKKDLLAVSDGLDIKVWNINTLECLSNIIIPKDFFDDLHKWPQSISTLFFINNKNKIYINMAFPHYDLPMLVYDIEGNKIKKVKINLKEINHMGSFTDKKNLTFLLVVINLLSLLILKKMKYIKVIFMIKIMNIIMLPLMIRILLKN